MNKHLIVLVIAVLLICVGLSGCEEKASSDNNEAEEITEHMLNSLENIDSYSYSSIGSIIINDVKTGMTDGYTELDITNFRLGMIQNISMSMIGNATTYIYILNNVEFTNKTESSGLIELTKKNITREIWANYDNHQSHKDFLEISDLEKIDDEVINGKDCYVINFIPDMDKYFEVMGNPMGTSFDYILNDIESKYWIDKGDYLPQRSYSKISMNTSSTIYGDMFYVYETDIYYSNYNADFTIEMPNWAINATWI